MKISSWFKSHLRVSTMVLLGLTIWSQNGCKPTAQDAVARSKAQSHSGAREGEDLNGNVDNETPTVLGQQMPNPYTVPNMKQAYQNMGRSDWNSVVATHNYIRFRPNSVDQLLTLTETLDLDLFDTPLDYMIAQEGDYYQDPAVPDEQVTYQYAVLPVGFTIPGDIAYDLLSPIHLPDNIAIESEAERLVGLNSDGEICTNCRVGAADSPRSNATPQPKVTDCGPDGHYDYDLHQCVPNGCAEDQHYDYVNSVCVDNCPAGYYWNSSIQQCVSNTPTTPPGRIMVDDTQLPNQGVPQANMVAKRWFKIERTYTDNNGYYSFTKHFGNKAKVLIKFENGDVTIRGIRGVRLWQFFNPVKYVFGRYNGGDVNTINYTFTRFTDFSSRGARYWAAASVQNAVQQYKSLVSTQGTATPPNNLKILISHAASAGVSGSTPLYHKRNASGLTEVYLRRYAMETFPVNLAVSTLAGVLERQVDMTIGYRSNTISSDDFSETIFHELSHAATLTQVGSAWYDAFVNAEVHEIVYSSGSSSPYGQGNTAFSPIIAVGESWAYHYGHFIADLRYGTDTTTQIEQDNGANSFYASGGGNHPHLDVLEGFNPTAPNDPFSWIPKGIFLDLSDSGPDRYPSSLVNDAVSGYTNQQMFLTLGDAITSPQAYRDRLLNNYDSAQASQVINLFHQYRYD